MWPQVQLGNKSGSRPDHILAYSAGDCNPPCMLNLNRSQKLIEEVQTFLSMLRDDWAAGGAGAVGVWIGDLSKEHSFSASSFCGIGFN